jgi:hypothetical protein
MFKKFSLSVIPAAALFATTALPSFAGTLPQIFLDPPVCVIHQVSTTSSSLATANDVWVSVSGPTDKAQAICSQLGAQLNATPIDFTAGNEPPEYADGFFLNATQDAGVIVSFDADTEAEYTNVTSVNRSSYNAAEAVSHKLPSLGFSQYGKLNSQYS